MSAILTRRDDPRSPLAKLTRDELWDLSAANGVDYGTCEAETTRDTMIKKLTDLGVNNFVIPDRVLGEPNWKQPFQIIRKEVPNPVVVSAPPVQSLDQMTIGQLRKEAKSRGLKITPKDGKIRLKEMLNGH